MNFRFKNTNRTLLILAIYQILGGVIGFAVICFWLMRTEDINGPVLLIFIIVLGLYSLSIKSGSLLIRKEYKRGIFHSMANQIVQIFAIALGGNKFDFLSGAKLRFGFNFSSGFKFDFEFGITSSFNLGINSGDKEYFFLANILAIFILFLLNDIYKEKFGTKVKALSENEEIITASTESEDAEKAAP